MEREITGYYFDGEKAWIIYKLLHMPWLMIMCTGQRYVKV